AAASACM
ncbi:putative tail assembly protein, partial [Escherichia coli EC1847]